jgi:hypothetical protein
VHATEVVNEDRGALVAPLGESALQLGEESVVNGDALPIKTS